MKLLSLNTYGGRVHEPFMDFIRAQAPTTDVFCLQEIPHGAPPKEESGLRLRSELFSELETLLPAFSSHFAVCEATTIDQAASTSREEGLALFVRREIEVLFVNRFNIFRESRGINSNGRADLYERFAQHARVRVHGYEISLINVHGAAFPGDKRDTPERLAQSDALITYTQNLIEPCVIMGDFNLLPETESVRRFVQAGFISLIERYGIKTTRGTLCKRLHPQFSLPPFTVQEYADYTFLSPSLSVMTFEVPDEPISDHLPMILSLDLSSSTSG